MRTLAELGSRRVVKIHPTASVADVVRLMEEHGVGCVVVVQDRTPVGIVTDRDLVLRVLRRGALPDATSVQRVMSAPVIALREDADPAEAAALMRARRVRRLPVVDAAGCVAGIVTFDDLVHYLGRTNADLADVLGVFPVPYEGG